MRWAKSYSIIDHQLLHGGYMQRLSQQAMSLYLFLVVVGDRAGRSFYSDASIMGILRLSEDRLEMARHMLIREGLIDYRSPYWWVKSLSSRSTGSAGRNRSAERWDNSRSDQASAKLHLEKIFQVLSKRATEEKSHDRRDRKD